jgi:hypothetical protein
MTLHPDNDGEGRRGREVATAIGLAGHPLQTQFAIPSATIGLLQPNAAFRKLLLAHAL